MGPELKLFWASTGPAVWLQLARGCTQLTHGPHTAKNDDPLVAQIRSARGNPHMGQHRTTSVSPTGLVLAHVWANSGKPDLGHQRAVILRGKWAMCKHILWARSGPYQFCYVGEALIMAAQERSLSTRSIEAGVYHTRQEPRCRLCNDVPETIQHIIAGCKMLAARASMECHNQLAG